MHLISVLPRTEYALFRGKLNGSHVSPDQGEGKNAPSYWRKAVGERAFSSYQEMKGREARLTIETSNPLLQKPNLTATKPEPPLSCPKGENL